MATLHAVYSFPDYIVIQPDQFRTVNIPNPKFQFKAPSNLTKGSRAILSFVVIIEDTNGNYVNFFVRINNTEVVNYTYNGPFLMAQTIHRVFDASIMAKGKNNDVWVGMADDTAGVVTMSDVVIWIKVDLTV